MEWTVKNRRPGRDGRFRRRLFRPWWGCRGLEVEEDFGPEVGHAAHDVGPGADEELEADLEEADFGHERAGAGERGVRRIEIEGHDDGVFVEAVHGGLGKSFPEWS